ncbi:hypothetical protein [Polyangium sp. y55x31]|uniref:hypothetical protein n=1 Tax=Polyangium sp. y55x31 TaxID=3042688 RepID=UPI0024827C5C|nr:hypothetical protein [Polyangium sp. y55x31]MDI1475401.1 hypothetical protein [Polyangium sp. y55x31]
MSTRRKGEPIACGHCLSFDIVVGGRSWSCLACDEAGRLPQELEVLPVEDELAGYLAQPALLDSASRERRIDAARLLLAFFKQGRGEAQA